MLYCFCSNLLKHDTILPIMPDLSSHAFQFLIAQHPLVQFLLHPVKKVGAAFVFPSFDVGIKAVTVFRINAEYLVKKRGKLFEWHVAVVDAAHLVDAVDKLHEVDGIARPLQEAGEIGRASCRERV